MTAREADEGGDYEPYAQNEDGNEFAMTLFNIDVVEDYLSHRRGQFSDSNDDIGLMYDEKDLALADTEGTYKVLVSVPVDENGSVIPKDELHGGRGNRGGGTLSLAQVRQRQKRETGPVPPAAGKWAYQRGKMPPGPPPTTRNVSPQSGNGPNGNSPSATAVTSGGGKLGGGGGNTARILAEQEKERLHNGGASPQSQTHADNDRQPDDGRAATRFEWRGGRHGGANERTADRPSGALARSVSSQQNPLHNPTVANGYYNSAGYTPRSPTTTGNTQALSEANEDPLSVEEEARQRRQLYRTCDTHWFTFSGEPSDILAFRSLIANDIYKDPPPTNIRKTKRIGAVENGAPLRGRRGGQRISGDGGGDDAQRAVLYINSPFSPEILAMILLFIAPSSRRQIVSISSVCQQWRYYCNYAPHWTRFRLNTFVGNFPKPVQHKLKQRKIVTRDELMLERKRAKSEATLHKVKAVCGAVGKEALVFLLILLFLLLAWAFAVALPALATNSLNSDGKIGLAIFFPLAVISIGQYFLFYRFIDYRYFADPDVIAGVGQLSRQELIAIRNTRAQNTGRGQQQQNRGGPLRTNNQAVNAIPLTAKSRFMQPSKTIRTVPPALFAFNVTAAVVVGLLWGRIRAIDKLVDMGEGTMVADGRWASTSWTDESGAGQEAKAFYKLPAPLSDPRWLLVNPLIFYSDADGSSVPDTTWVPSAPSESWVVNRTDFFDITCNDLPSSCFSLLYFDSEMASPQFNASVPVDSVIPVWWNNTFGSCSLNATSCMANVTTGAPHGVRSLTELTALLLRSVTADQLGFDPVLVDHSQQTAQSFNECPLKRTSRLPGPGATSVAATGVFVAVANGADYFREVIASAAKTSPYTYLSSLRDFASNQRSSSQMPIATSYAAIVKANYYATEAKSGQAQEWYESNYWTLSGDRGSGLVLASNRTVRGNISGIAPLFNAFNRRCSSSTSSDLTIPLLRYEVRQSQAFAEDRRMRLLLGQFLLVAAFVFLACFIFIIANVCAPSRKVDCIRDVIVAVFAILFFNPLILIAAGAICIVQYQQAFDWSNELLGSSTEAPLMCDTTAGVGMVAVGGVIVVVGAMIFLKLRFGQDVM